MKNSLLFLYLCIIVLNIAAMDDLRSPTFNPTERKRSATITATSPDTTLTIPPQKKYSKKKPHLSRMLSQQHLPKKQSEKEKQSQKYKSKNNLIQAILSQDEQKVKNYLPNYDPNEKGETHNTPLHHAVLLKNQHICYRLNRDHRINSLITNSHNLAPYELLNKQDVITYAILYEEVMIRKNLDLIVHSLILTNEAFVIHETIDPTYIMEKIKHIKNHFEKQLTPAHQKKVFPQYATNEFILQMILYRLKDTHIIQNFFDQQRRNPNYQDALGNSQLHLLIYLRDIKKINTLIKNPTIISLIQNTKQEYPHQLLSTEENRTLRMKLFARHSLELWIQKEIPALILANPIIDQITLKKNSKEIKIAIKNIKQAFKKVKDNQEQKLPEQTDFPKYATNKFLFTLILVHMKHYKPVNNIDFNFQLTESSTNISLEELNLLPQAPDDKSEHITVSTD